MRPMLPSVSHAMLEEVGKVLHVTVLELVLAVVVVVVLMGVTALIRPPGQQQPAATAAGPRLAARRGRSAQGRQ